MRGGFRRVKFDNFTVSDASTLIKLLLHSFLYGVREVTFSETFHLYKKQTKPI